MAPAARAATDEFQADRAALVRRLARLHAPLAQRRTGFGIVPTMGALHAGHLSLVQHARRHAGRVVVTDFRQSEAVCGR